MQLGGRFKHWFGRKCPNCGERGHIELVGKQELSRTIGYSVAVRRDRLKIVAISHLHCEHCNETWEEQGMEESDS